jgi:tRNA-specific 2-thiouridylase
MTGPHAPAGEAPETAARVMIAMSGGVDSSVAALLAMEAGHDCVGVTMKLFENEDIADESASGERSCCSLADADDASRVCGMLGIPFYVFDFTRDFRREVMERFVSEYAAGRTPNPCIDCNRYIKYDRLYRRARDMGFDCIATGHYAQVGRDEDTGRWILRKAVDGSKDQSYVLYGLTQEQLAHSIFPLGKMRKDEVRGVAASRGFANSRKPDSQDICFVPGGRYAEFIESFAGRGWPPGDFVDAEGNVLGRHEGIIRYTVGQRKGLGRAFGRRLYVAAIRPERNEVVLAGAGGLLTRVVRVERLNMVAVAALDGAVRVTAKIRYNQVGGAAVAERTGEDEVTLTFDEPQRAPAPGQAAVMYDGDVVVGGGIIM